MKTFCCIFLWQWFDISHATNFQKAIFEDVKYFITEVHFFYMYFTSVWYYQQVLVNYHYSFQIVLLLKRDLL